MLKPQDLEQRIQANIPGSQVKAYDLTGGGDHWKVTVSGEVFQDLSPIQQHQLIYKAVGEWMNKEVHALAIEVKEAV